MIDYTIKEYDFKAGKYTTVGYATAASSEEAKSIYMAENNWKPRDGVMLFARIPLCR